MFQKLVDNEDIEWTNVVIYNKGTKLENNYNHEEIMLENVGREGHTYYKYICDNYDNLDDYTIFLQDNPFDHCSDIINLLKSIIIYYKDNNNELNLNFNFLGNNLVKTTYVERYIVHNNQCKNIMIDYEEVFTPLKI